MFIKNNHFFEQKSANMTKENNKNSKTIYLSIIYTNRIRIYYKNFNIYNYEKNSNNKKRNMKSIFADFVNWILKDNIHPVFCQYTVELNLR